ncbi:uncharacterized protein LOC111087394 isoform X2 [Limulus polyphemus]|uniref:Uncharacterized protein LOC111087394 isoform X2 n=1 Tax=Limulus polyphemus TaxID=6850 RepID=A0ABM1T135_LIMPO|nr:uncharacterized protein LOC111087394 isoform X2 [Limulus polyphemus]
MLLKECTQKPELHLERARRSGFSDQWLGNLETQLGLKEMQNQANYPFDPYKIGKRAIPQFQPIAEPVYNNDADLVYAWLTLKGSNYAVEPTNKLTIPY